MYEIKDDLDFFQKKFRFDIRIWLQESDEVQFYFRYAKEFDEENFARRCWEMINNKTLDCIHSEGMLEVDRDILECCGLSDRPGL